MSDPAVALAFPARFRARLSRAVASSPWRPAWSVPAAMIPDRLAGWWLASAAGTIAVLALDYALGLRPAEPDTAVAAVTAGIRLDDALRGYLAEQGSKRLARDDLWRLVMATMRLRPTAHSLAGVHGHAGHGRHAEEARAELRQRAAELAGFYGQVAVEVGRVGPAAGRPASNRRPAWCRPRPSRRPTAGIRICSGSASTCTIWPRTPTRSPGRPRGWPSCGRLPGGVRARSRQAVFQYTL